MKTLIAPIFKVLSHLGGFGLLGLGVLDSSFMFFVPFGNDLLMIAMSARHHSRLPYYALMAAAGSVLGCLITDLVFRKGGEAGLERYVPGRRLDYIKRQFGKKAGWTLALASLIPPPFPFTPFVAAAAALKYPRRRLLAVIGASRFTRFTIEGLLAVWLGRDILKLADSRLMVGVVVSLIVVAVVGSAVSAYSWVKKSRKA